MKILIVDDDIEVRRIVRFALTLASDFDVLEADSALPALRKILEEHPDAILLDMVMPEIDGLSLLRLLKISPATSRIPVVLLSSARTVSDAERLRSLGAAAIVRKPFDPGQLAQDVQSAVRRAA